MNHRDYRFLSPRIIPTIRALGAYCMPFTLRNFQLMNGSLLSSIMHQIRHWMPTDSGLHDIRARDLCEKIDWVCSLDASRGYTTAKVSLFYFATMTTCWQSTFLSVH